MKWKFIIAIIISVITMNCTTNMMLVVNKNPLPEGIKINSKPIFKDKITLVIARKGAICLDNPIDCKSKKMGVFPESLYAKLGEGDSASPYGSHAADAIRNHLKKIVTNYDMASFQSVYEWENFQNQFKTNTLIISVKDDASMHWSMFVSVLTIGLIPGYNPIQPENEIVWYDKQGAGKELRFTATANGHVWHHTTFFLWSYIYSHIKSKDMYDAYYEQLFSTLESP
ncbi:MAG: hypothetical protein KBF93_23070 [Leptospiraceae bacterium]|jgi:hypothetical protein|nr:hypothetical protein [Leptospiraceae bacterium]